MTLFRRRPEVLLVEDDEDLREQLEVYLADTFKIHTAGSASEALSRLEATHADLAVVDIRLPDTDGLQLLGLLLARRPNMSVIVMTAYANVELAVRAMKRGAADFINKPFGADELAEMLTLHLQPAALRKQRSEARKSIVGESPQMLAVWDEIELFAHTDVTILLQGETGVGKELLAQAIHRLSKFADGPLVPLDCACLPQELVESEIFGHESGAFTGANGLRRGRLEMANNGTLFLDEIANLTYLVQAKLLRALQERQIHRLGCKSPKPIELDFRVISASNIDLAAAAEKGTFRSDLLYRINPVTIHIPALRDREGDVARLAEAFLDYYAQRFQRPVTHVAQAALEHLEAYPWPGNVRELKNVMKRAVLTARGGVEVDDLHLSLLESRRPEGERPVSVRVNLDPLQYESMNLKSYGEDARAQAEEQVLQRVLASKALNRLQLAEFLQVDTKTLRSKLARYGLD